MASSLLRFKRGNAGIGGTVPALKPGEPAFSLNNFDLFVGFNTTVSGNKFFGSHRYWTREDESTRGSGINLVEASTNGSNYITLAAPSAVGSAVTYYFPADQGTANSVLLNDGSGSLSWVTNIPILSGIVTFTNPADSYSKDTGAVIIEGGLGVEKSVNIGTNLNVGNNFTVAGIGTIPLFNSEYSTIQHVRGLNLNYSGIGTIASFNSTYSNINTGIVTNLSGTYISYSGIGTIETLYSTVSNVSTLYNTNLFVNTGIITTLTGTNLNYSGVGTISNVRGTNLNYSGIGTVQGSFNVGVGGTIISASSNGFVGISTNNPSDSITLYKDTRIASYGSVAKLSVGRITDGSDSIPGSLFYPESGTVITNSTTGGYYLNNVGSPSWYVDYNGNQYNKGFVRVGPSTSITNIRLDPNGNISATGILTAFSVSIGSTQVISNERQLQNILSLDAITINTIETAVSNAPNTFTDLKISGISTFIGIATFASGIHVVSGISTLGVVTATDLTLVNLKVSGLGTITTLDSTTSNITNANIVSGVVTTLSGTTATYNTGNLTTLNATTGNIVTGVVTTISGTTANYNTGNFTTGNIVTGVVTTLSGTTANYNTGNLTTLNATTGNIVTGVVTTLSGTTATYNTGNLTTLNATTGNIVTGVVTTLSGTTATYNTGNFTTGNIVTGVVTTISGTTATYTNSNITNLNVSGITTVTTLTGTNLNYSGIATLPTIDGTTIITSSEMCMRQ